MAEPTPPPSHGNTPRPAHAAPPTPSNALSDQSSVPALSTSDVGASGGTINPAQLQSSNARPLSPPAYREQPTSASVSPDDYTHMGGSADDGTSSGGDEENLDPVIIGDGDREEGEMTDDDDDYNEDNDEIDANSEDDELLELAGFEGSREAEGGAFSGASDLAVIEALQGDMGGSSGTDQGMLMRMGGMTQAVRAAGASGKKKRDRKGKGKARSLAQQPLGGGSELSIGSAEGSKAKRTRGKAGVAFGAGTGGGGGGGGAGGNGRDSGAGSGAGGRGGGRGGGKGDQDIWESDIVQAWNKEFGDVCRDPVVQAPAAAKA